MKTLQKMCSLKKKIISTQWQNIRQRYGSSKAFTDENFILGRQNLNISLKSK